MKKVDRLREALNTLLDAQKAVNRAFPPLRVNPENNDLSRRPGADV